MRGDQIYVMREWLNFQEVYQHHGIDCGDGTVIHYRKPSETIECTSLETFALGGSIYIKPYATCFLPEVVVHRAQSRLGEQQYNLLSNNCEHFATWCKTGVNYSDQIQDFMPYLGAIAPRQLSEPIAQALRTSSPAEATRLLNQALADVKQVWDDLQPKYHQAREDMTTWERVAFEALKQGREDLARAAIERKLSAKTQATQLQAKLEQMASLTETLLENHRARA
ncbi:lecithin retinol acyltransferase family protein [Neosynechococcus sphagnicola]|nr:lecithin retinol acyltransferase family protein [Neosynechococcus sphagnicola]